MAPAKTNSACKRVKRSRKDSLFTLTNENDDDPNNQMIIEYQEILHPLFQQPSSHTIDQSIAYSSTDQPSSLSSQSTNRSTPALIGRPSSSLGSRSTLPSANHSMSQSGNHPSPLPLNSSISQSADASSPSSNNRPLSSSAVNRSVAQSVNGSSSSSVNPSTSSSNNRPLSSSSVNRSVSQLANGSSSSSVNPSTSSSSNNRSLSSSSANGLSSSSVNPSTSSSNNRSSSSSSVNRSVAQSANGSSSSSVNPSTSSSNNRPLSSSSANGSSPSSSNNRSSSSSSANGSVAQSANGSSSSSVNPSTSSSNNRSSSSSSVNRSVSQSANGSSSSSVNPPTSSSNNRSLSSSANSPLISYLTTDQPPSSQSETNPSSSSKPTSSNFDTVEVTANNNSDDSQDDAIRKESVVWEYARRNIDNQTATCSICNAVIRTTNWSTTGLRKHLTQVHKLMTMAPVVAAKKSTISQKLRKELHELIVKSIIQDSRSFNDFRRPGMMKFLKKAVPGYVPPHRITVARRLKRLHGFYKQRLQQQLLEVNKISITCDFWSDRSLKSYLCITGHYVTHDFGYQSTILSFDAFYDRHHGIRIAKIIREKLNNFNLFNKLLCITTDGAGNMRTMCENLKDIKFDWIWCVAHRYHLTVNNALGFWPEKKKKKKKQNDNNNNTNDDDNTEAIIDNNISNNSSGGYDDATGIGGFNSNEDEQSFWDDATKDRSNGQQHILDFDQMKGNESADGNDDEYDDEILNVEEIIYGVIGEPSNVEQIKSVIADESSNPDDIKFVVDDETFIDYMTNNNLIRDDWDLNLNESNNVVIDEINKRMVYMVINKCRLLITILKQSTILNGYFNQSRLEFNIKRGLPADCVTRWNSTYFLVDSFINAKKIIMKFFGDKNLYDVRRALIERLISIELHHDDWQILMDLHIVLKPFYLATRLMSVRLYPTAGLCYYTVKILLNYLMKDDNNDSTQIKSLKLMLFSQFEYYFCSDEEQLNLLKKYAFFDPLGFSVLTENDIRNVEQEIKEIIRNEKIYQDDLPPISSSNSLSSTSTAAVSSTSKFPPTIDQFLLACGESPIIHDYNLKSRRLTVNEELTLYKEYIINFYREYRTRAFALDFWKKHQTDFPVLSKLARAYLSTPGTSLSSESAFSISAYVARKERARLSSENLSYTMFMKDKIASED